MDDCIANPDAPPDESVTSEVQEPLRFNPIFVTDTLRSILVCCETDLSGIGEEILGNAETLWDVSVKDDCAHLIVEGGFLLLAQIICQYDVEKLSSKQQEDVIRLQEIVIGICANLVRDGVIETLQDDHVNLLNDVLNSVLHFRDSARSSQALRLYCCLVNCLPQSALTNDNFIVNLSFVFGFMANIDIYEEPSELLNPCLNIIIGLEEVNIEIPQIPDEVVEYAMEAIVSISDCCRKLWLHECFNLHYLSKYFRCLDIVLKWYKTLNPNVNGSMISKNSCLKVFFMDILQRLKRVETVDESSLWFLPRFASCFTPWTEEERAQIRTVRKSLPQFCSEEFLINFDAEFGS